MSKSAAMGPPEPQKVGFGVRVSAIQQKPTNPLKVTKSHPKGTQMEAKWAPKGPKDPPGTLKNAQKDGEGKSIPKEQKKNCLSK